MAIPYKKLFGLCSVLPRWGKHGLALCLVTSMPSLQDGRKAGVWFLFFGKHVFLQMPKHAAPLGQWIGLDFFFNATSISSRWDGAAPEIGRACVGKEGGYGGGRGRAQKRAERASGTVR